MWELCGERDVAVAEAVNAGRLLEDGTAWRVSWTDRGGGISGSPTRWCRATFCTAGGCNRRSTWRITSSTTRTSSSCPRRRRAHQPDDERTRGAGERKRRAKTRDKTRQNPGSKGPVSPALGGGAVLVEECKCPMRGVRGCAQVRGDPRRVRIHIHGSRPDGGPVAGRAERERDGPGRGNVR